jgi:cell division protein YceG involved in septum cleavage
MPLPYIKEIMQIKTNWARRMVIWPLTFVGTLLFVVLVFLLQTKITSTEEVSFDRTSNSGDITTPFPVSVDPAKKIIVDNDNIEDFLTNKVASNHTNFKTTGGWLALVQSKLSKMDWYQTLATPMSRTLVIYSGQRSEEIASNFARILGWTKSEQTDFINKMANEAPEFKNGKMYPGKYTVTTGSNPESVALSIADRFNADIRTRYTSDVEAKVPLGDALIIASLLEREAYDFTDMRYISGVIWNRLFIGMRLQIDATLQYARGNSDSKSWWPVPTPEDKYIKSPFNTYQNNGLPPEPIANPSIDAIIAALNPRETSCLFYFHDTNGKFYCTETYEEHVSMLKKIYGQGK